MVVFVENLMNGQYLLLPCFTLEFCDRFALENGGLPSMTRLPAEKTVWPRGWIQAMKEGRLDIMMKYRQFAGGTWEINGITPEGLPVLLVALYHGKQDIANWILNQEYELCPWTAAAIGDLNWLKNWYANVNEKERLFELTARSSDGWTIMHLAAFFGKLEVIDWLIDLQAPFDALSENDTANQPLHAALASRNEQIAERLIDAGAPLTYEAEGWTPLRLARENGLVAVAEKIEQLTSES